MSKKKTVAFIGGMVAAVAVISGYVLRKKAENKTYIAESVEPLLKREMGFYETYIKRIFDVICAVGIIICFGPLYLFLAVLVKIKLGSPILFVQERPGIIGSNGKETIFKMYKFRSMTDERSENGELLPDEVRLTKFGMWLRRSSLDELGEIVNLLNGTMSVVGPRPQLVRDMVFMTKEQRIRHTAKPGLSGLAQVNGRNAITWEDKLQWDQEYIKKVSFWGDIKIIAKTVTKALIKQEGIMQSGMATAEDFGDYLLRTGKIEPSEYVKKQVEAKKILSKCGEKKQRLDIDDEIDSVFPTEKYSVLMSLYSKEKPEYLNMAIQSMLEQTYAPDEIVIVKDGKITPELQEILNRYRTAYPEVFNIVGYEENCGLGFALNYGLKHCKNELIARMDTDDISRRDRCWKQVRAFELHPEYTIIGSAVDEFYGTPDKITGCRRVPTQPEEIYAFAKRRSAFNHPSVMYRKSKVLEFHGYGNLRRNQDVDLFGRMQFGGCKAANFRESLLFFRSDENLAKRRKSWENTWSYIDTIRNFYNMGYAKLSDVVVIAIAQIGVYIMPIGMQNWMYSYFLRR